MSCGSGGCCGSRCGGCKFMVAVVALLSTVTTVATLIGVYMTHVTMDGWKFGTIDGSLSVIAFLVSVMCWLKLVKKLCPCSSGGSCGACPGCGTSPCSCK